MLHLSPEQVIFFFFFFDLDPEPNYARVSGVSFTTTLMFLKVYFGNIFSLRLADDRNRGREPSPLFWPSCLLVSPGTWSVPR